MRDYLIRDLWTYELKEDEKIYMKDLATFNCLIKQFMNERYIIGSFNNILNLLNKNEIEVDNDVLLPILSKEAK